MTKRNFIPKSKDSQLKHRLLCGVGYNSGGKHPVAINKENYLPYITWSNMIKRCYGDSNRLKNLSYKDCVVSSEFHDYQYFAEWYTNHPYYGLGYYLDKDILNKGNKVYSEKSCCLVPMEINNLFISRDGDRGDLPIGVTNHRQTGRFVARVSTNAGRIYLGLHNTEQEAHQAYVVAKEAYVKEVANEWRGRIDERVYDALMNWTASPLFESY